MYRPDLFRHVLVEVVFVDDSVEFEENAVLPAPAPYCLQAQQVTGLGPRPPPDLLVHLLVEAVHGDGHDVQVVAALRHPTLSHLAAVTDHSDALDVQLLLAVTDHLSKILS